MPAYLIVYREGRSATRPRWTNTIATPARWAATTN
jgi:hypothetical protein